MKDVTKEKIFEIVNANIENGILNFGEYDTDLSEIGMDSVHFIQIIVSLEEIFHCEVPDSKLLLVEMNTINKIYDVLTSIESDF